VIDGCKIAGFCYGKTIESNLEMNMAKTIDYSRLRRLLKIYLAVQVGLVLLLLFMAVNFQSALQSEGRPQRFLHSVVATLVIQMALFFPMKKLAGKEADREIESCAPDLDGDKLKSLRNRRMYADVLKMAVIIFFVTFILKAPNDRFVLSLVYFSFILTVLSYYQCVSFAIKRAIPKA
jgi:hypothetical protein